MFYFKQVGQEGVGKTTLLECLKTGKNIKKKFLSTDGIEIDENDLVWQVKYPEGKKDVDVKCLDFAGQVGYM